MGPTMDDNTKQAAQEYLAGKLTEDERIYEAQQNRAIAVARGLQVWKSFRDSIMEKCREWNTITQEETLSCKETPLGDLRIWCAARSKQMIVHYDSQKLLIVIKNAGRLEHEKDVILFIRGYRKSFDREDRDVRLERNDEPINPDMLIVGELRVLTGMSRQRTP
jgi:hypothetical protein